MNIKNFFIAGNVLICFTAAAQNKHVLVSGPWAGNIELRNATIWAAVSAEVKTVAVKISNNNATERIIKYKNELGNEFNAVKIELNELKPNTLYTYTLVLNGKDVTLPYKTQFITKDLWQYRKPAPDFNFIAGSCSYFNEPEFDRPGKPYGMDSSIFITMANTPAAFNLWLGDSWYTREVDYYSTWGLKNRVSRDRSMKVVQKLLAAMSQYYLWDDHDFGPNNSGKSYILKAESRNIFKEYTLNPTYGEEGKGIYTTISYSDVDLFLTDNRYFRSEVSLTDSVNGKPNMAKTYFGNQQMDWLKNALLYSKATFKIIATGGQVLNPVSTFECMRYYSFEYNDLLSFLAGHKISGVIFLSGDRHHSEIIKLERPGLYPLYDVTISPLTATVSTVKDAELVNNARVPGTLVEAQNFGNISVTGNKNARILKVLYTGIRGEKLGEWSVSENELRSEK